MNRQFIGSENSPISQVDQLFQQLVLHYEEGEDRELRAAAKLLLVALDKFRRHGGKDWEQLLDQYVEMAKQRPEKLERILKSQRANTEQFAVF